MARQMVLLTGPPLYSSPGFSVFSRRVAVNATESVGDGPDPVEDASPEPELDEVAPVLEPVEDAPPDPADAEPDADAAAERDEGSPHAAPQTQSKSPNH